MRKLLNTLYVTTPDSYLAREGENILIRRDEEIVFRVPVHNIEAIVYFGYPGARPSLLGNSQFFNRAWEVFSAG